MANARAIRFGIRAGDIKGDEISAGQSLTRPSFPLPCQAKPGFNESEQTWRFTFADFVLSLVRTQPQLYKGDSQACFHRLSNTSPALAIR